MKSKILEILSNKHFFKIVTSSGQSVKFKIEEQSQILIKNIYINWLQYLHSKTQKHMPIFIKNAHESKSMKEKPPFGIIQNNDFEYKNSIFYLNDCNDISMLKSKINFSVILPRQDLMQYFIQWQRYRKYWWSSITTTPSLFAISDVKQTETEANVEIVARLHSQTYPVEHIKMIINDDVYRDCSQLSCTMSLESALLILLMDSCNSNEEYLRLHRKVAPYKISFALHFQESNNKTTLKELATLLYNRLLLEKISAWLPDFSMNIETQIIDNLRRGITYTAILSEATLETGIFHLLNSSTLLKEQIHVADFHTYVALICSAK